ncbi:MAG: metallophosphoesterase [Clostridia bacterium]|nr:metallophosphoesterase [Clostridia bacterium]
MSLYVCGDTHGTLDIHKLTTKLFPDREMTEEDYVLVCGDCGAVWDCGPSDAYLRRWFQSKRWTVLFVDGNHENHDALDRYPVTEWKGGKVHRICDSVIHLMRGQVYEIDGHTLFTMGGAASHDKQYRKEGVSWWARELPSPEEYAEALHNLASHTNRVDYVISHCASSRTQAIIDPAYRTDALTDFLDQIEEIDFGHWYFGHYHVDRDLDEKHSALYDRVIKLW